MKLILKEDLVGWEYETDDSGTIVEVDVSEAKINRQLSIRMYDGDDGVRLLDDDINQLWDMLKRIKGGKQ